MMQRRAFKKFTSIAAACALMLGNVIPAAQACTGIRLIAADGSVVYARTLEFGLDLKSEIMMVPRGFSRTGTTPDGKGGLKWTAKYASVGMNGAGLPDLFDGLNEKGLGAGMFYFPTSAGYMPYTAEVSDRTISQWEFVSYVLGNFATVDEVKENIGNIVVASSVFSQWGFAPEAHYIVHDATGKSIVVEYVGGKLNVYDNPLGVITNTPGFDFHMNNLRQYTNFSMTGKPSIKLGSVEIVPTGQGSGMLGLPGDFTPPSRFVRAVAFSQSVFQPKTEQDAVLQVFKILNQFDIPKGSSRDGEKDANGNVMADYTIWTGASDLKSKRYFFRTYDNSQIRSVDLMKMDIDGKDMVKVSIQGDEKIEDVTPAGRP